MNGQHQSIFDVAIVGGGGMGTALAKLLGERGKRVSMWVREADLAERINETRINDMFLPGVPLPPQVVATARSAMILAARQGIEMPITEAVTRLLDGETAPGDAVRALMARPLRSERER